MSTPWQAFLNSPENDPDRPPYLDRPAYCGLSGYGLLRISGEDAALFLQGQCTCDVKALSPGRSGVGAFCTPKGRVIASFRLLRAEQGFYLLLAADLAEAVRKRLQTYVLRSKVVLEDLTPRRGMIGLLVRDESWLEICEIELPEVPGTWLETPEALVLRLNDSTGRILVVADLDVAPMLWSCLSEKLPHIHPEVWRLKEIKAGFPEITTATSEEFLPQMLNLDALEGISFQKGCYTGQEIVTRTHFLGQVKRRMFHLHYQGEFEAAAGTLIYETSETEPKNVGQVVTAVMESTGVYQILAVLGTDHAGSLQLRIASPEGSKLEWLPLPYPLESPRE